MSKSPAFRLAVIRELFGQMRSTAPLRAAQLENDAEDIVNQLKEHVEGCPGCGIRRTDLDRVRELEVALRGLLDQWVFLGTNETKGPMGFIIVEINRQRVRDAREALDKEAAS